MELSISKQDDYKLSITYKQEILDGVNWQTTGQIRDGEEVLFQIKYLEGQYEKMVRRRV